MRGTQPLRQYSCHSPHALYKKTHGNFEKFFLEKSFLMKITKRIIKNRTVRYMRSLGTYREEYDDLIDIYVDMVFSYQNIIETYPDQDDISTSSAAGTAKKNPIISTVENLRKDILQYSDRLCLNPKMYQSMLDGSAVEKKEKTVSEILEQIKD